MLELEKLIWKNSPQHRAITVKDRTRAQRFFEDWRDRLIAIHARHIRLCHSIERQGIIVRGITPIDANWSNAAIHVLTIPSEAVQDWFLRSPIKEKNRIVQAVLKDGGIRNASGIFIELPPL